MMNKQMLAAVLGATLAGMSLMAGAAQATVVTFDDSVGNSLAAGGGTFFPAGGSFSDQGLTFINNGDTQPNYLGVENAGVNGNGTNDMDFNYAQTSTMTITRTGGGTFNLNSAQFAISFCSQPSNPGLCGSTSDTMLINGTPLTISNVLTTYTLNLLGVSQVTISGLNDPGGAYWLADNLNYSATPLPSTWLMLLSGFLGLGFFAYLGTKKGSAAIAAA